MYTYNLNNNWSSSLLTDDKNNESKVTEANSANSAL